MSEHEQWLSRARRIVDATRPLLDNYGLAPSANLTVDADKHPCPGYRHDIEQILFCPPVVESPADRLRWLFFCRVMGCDSVAEAREFYDCALPLIICHELCHHLRFGLGLGSTSSFVEEQVCDRVAMALIHRLDVRGAGPAPRERLDELGRRCRVMKARLAASYGTGAGSHFLPGLGDALVAADELAPDRLAQLETLALRSDVPLDELLGVAVGHEALLDARSSRGEARDLVDSRYTTDPSEYWYVSLTWVSSYLERDRPVDLQTVVRDHLTVRSQSQPANPRQDAAADPTALPMRGSKRWDSAVARLRDDPSMSDLLIVRAAAGDAAMEVVTRARVAALLRDLGAPSVGLEACVSELLDQCSTRVHHAKQLPESPLGRLGQRQLLNDAHRLAAEVSTLVVPLPTAAATYALTQSFRLSTHEAGPLQHLTGRAVPETDRAKIGDALAGNRANGELPEPSRLVAAALAHPNLEASVLMTVEKTVALEAVQLFHHLEPDRLWSLAERAVAEVVDPDEIIFKEGEPGRRLFLIMEGQVRVEKTSEDGDVRHLAVLGKGASFGEIALFDGEARSATARALGGCRVLSIDGDALARFGRDNPEVYEALLRALSERLRATSEELVG